MNRKAMFGDVIVPFLIICIFIIGFMWVSDRSDEITRTNENDCNGFYSYDSEHGCCNDCKKLELEYFKYEFSSSFFGANVKNCYCQENNNVKQIW